MKEEKASYQTTEISPEAAQRFEDIREIGQRAIDKAIAENKRLGIPNYWSVDGKIVSDQDA